MNIVSGNRQELQIVRDLSSLDISEIKKLGDIKELINGIRADQNSVEDDASRLDRLRREKSEGNFISNWMKGLPDKVEDAHIDLNKSIGRLTQRSSQLLIMNTAISKILIDQQGILLQQQNLLKQQADNLKEQNLKILDQQNALEQQQKEINAANQGLLDAKGVTQEQAQQLVGCVVRVSESEKKIDVANQELRNSIDQHLRESVDNIMERLTDGFVESDKRYGTFEQKIAENLSAQAEQVKTEIKKLSKDHSDFATTLEDNLQAHIKFVMEKLCTQDATAQQSHDDFLSQLRQYQHETISALELKTQESDEVVKVVGQRHLEHKREFDQELMVQRESLAQDQQNLWTRLNGQVGMMGNIMTQLAQLKEDQHKNARSNRLTLFAVASVALFTLGWQLVMYLH